MAGKGETFLAGKKAKGKFMKINFKFQNQFLGQYK